MLGGGDIGFYVAPGLIHCFGQHSNVFVRSLDVVKRSFGLIAHASPFPTTCQLNGPRKIKFPYCCTIAVCVKRVNLVSWNGASISARQSWTMKNLRVAIFILCCGPMRTSRSLPIAQTVSKR